jgi:hypothetical protein
MDFKILDVMSYETDRPSYGVTMPSLFVTFQPIGLDDVHTAYVYPPTLEDIKKLKACLQDAYERDISFQIAKDKKAAEKVAKEKFYETFKGRVI